MLVPDDVIAGRFRVEAVIGEGGLARVYRVRHLQLGSVHALKCLRQFDPGLAERLLLEGRIQAQLRHPNIVPVTDVVQSGDQVALVMELLDPLNLRTLLEQRGRLELDEALGIFSLVLAAVAFAHDAGVLHRDLKPANVMLVTEADGTLTPRVADFGVAKVVDGQTLGAALGTPGFLAPEQVLDPERTDERSDVFALGVILYEMLAGELPYLDRKTGTTSIAATLRGDHVPIGELGLALPEHIARAVACAMSIDQDARFADCRMLAQAVFAEHPELIARVGASQVGAPLQSDELFFLPPPPSDPNPFDEDVSDPCSYPTLTPDQAEELGEWSEEIGEWSADTLDDGSVLDEFAAVDSLGFLPEEPTAEPVESEALPPSSLRFRVGVMSALLLGAAMVGLGSYAKRMDTGGLADAKSTVTIGAELPGPVPSVSAVRQEGVIGEQAIGAQPAATKRASVKAPSTGGPDGRWRGEFDGKSSSLVLQSKGSAVTGVLTLGGRTVRLGGQVRGDHLTLTEVGGGVQLKGQLTDSAFYGTLQRRVGKGKAFTLRR